jgi:hypothetical protein
MKRTLMTLAATAIMAAGTLGAAIGRAIPKM